MGLYAVKPLVDALKDTMPLYIYTRRENRRKACTYLGVEDAVIKDIESLTSRWKSLLDFCFKQILVDNNFFSQYKTPIAATPLKFIVTLGKMVPKPPQRIINALYHYLWCLLNVRPVFKTKKVIYITRSGNTYLLNNFYHDIYTIVESWDHPVKSPFFVKSKVIFTWNKELSADISLFQGGSNIQTIFPLKFRYLAEIADSPVLIEDNQIARELDFIRTNDYILYVCTYSSFSKNGLFEDEKELIMQISKMAQRQQKILYVKPHPHALSTDFSFLKSDFNIRLGISATLPGFNYIFTDQDQYYKLELLRHAKLIINVGTTLVLEASFVNENILQLDAPNGFSFSYASTNYHVKKYLNSNKWSVKLKPHYYANLETYISNGVSGEFALFLRQWICDKSYKDSKELLIKYLTMENH